MKKQLIGLGVAVLLFGGVVSANANLITNGSFEGGPSSFFQQHNAISTGISGWTVTSGSIDWIGNYWEASDGINSLDMNGGSAGTILSDSFATSIGTEYVVTFDMAGNPNVTGVMDLSLTINTIQNLFSFDTTGHTTTDMGWSSVSASFTAIANTTQLQFSSLEIGNGGAALDNVVVGLADPVPEPATMLLFGTGLICLVGSRLRKKKK
jgi:choice-of-anchor C domain-containing protein